MTNNSRDSRRRHTWLGFCFLALVAGAFAWIVIAAQKRQEIDELARITHYVMVGVHNYHDVVGELPSPSKQHLDWDGGSSWRVIVTPYIQSWGFSQSFPSASATRQEQHNWAALPDNPITEFFSAEQPPNTQFIAIIGEGTAWDRDAYLTFDDLSATTALMIVTVPRSDIHWMDPGDWTTDELINNMQQLGDEPIALGFADAQCVVVPANIPPEIVRRFCDVESARDASLDLLAPYKLND